MQQDLTSDDFTTKRQPRWCPGCGDFAILKSLRKALVLSATARNKVVCVSGIGCAARLPYYINSYGFHTIHGRAAPIATGVKIANPDLDVWVIGGDGDFLSIGTNHLIHALRRNVDINFLLINNAVYGLTKGQYSPTTIKGTSTPSTPMGVVENPINAAQLSLAAGARYVARIIDVMQLHLPDLLVQARNHKGAALVEILQNCPVFNDKVWQQFQSRDGWCDKAIFLEHGTPMLFGAERDKGLVFDADKGDFKVVEAKTAVQKKNIDLHDKTNLAKARQLADMAMHDDEQKPLALGILYELATSDYNSVIEKNRPYKPLSKQDFANILDGEIGWKVK